MGSLHRTQVLLEDWHYEYLKSIAQRDSKSLSEVLRDILSEYIRKGDFARNPIEGIAGIGIDEEASGREHDRWLYAKR
jgi:hypothetical protein